MLPPSGEPHDEPSGESPPARPVSDPDEPRTRIIRRQPSGNEPTNLVRPLDEPETGLIAPPQRVRRLPRAPDNATAVAASTAAIITGWATAVVATELISGWWRTDRLFCVGVGFLTAVFAAGTIAGVVALLLRRRLGIYLILVASVLALLIFACIFVAGAHMAGVVRAIPVLPVVTGVLAAVPATWRWTR